MDEDLLPDALQIDTGLPSALFEYDQWVCWRTHDRDGTITKTPINPKTGLFASTSSPDTWTSFEEACKHVANGEVEGLGFVLTEDDPFVGIDLDDCRDPKTGHTEGWAMAVIETLDSYTEVSPSGTGFHVLVCGRLPDDRNRRHNLEIYEDKRFFTITGDHLEGTPGSIRERQVDIDAVYEMYISPDDDGETGAEEGIQEGVNAEERPDTQPASNAGSSLSDDRLVEKACDAANGEKFHRLWRGSTSGYESHSEADMALATMLAFWTGGDTQQMDRLFRESGLMRGKWDEVHYADGSTYGEKTLERAITCTNEFYDAEAAATETETEGDMDEMASDAPAGRIRPEMLDCLATLEKHLLEACERNEELEAELQTARERQRELEAALEEKRNRGWSAAILSMLRFS